MTSVQQAYRAFTASIGLKNIILESKEAGQQLTPKELDKCHGGSCSSSPACSYSCSRLHGTFQTLQLASLDIACLAGG